MTMTYKELYDNMLDECCTCETCGRGGSDLEENDPIAYRCGFSDFTDSLQDDDLMCSNDHCRNKVDKEQIYNADMDDDILCNECMGIEEE